MFEEVGYRIREIREEKKITLEELGNKIGKSKSFISKLETGKKKINLENLQLIASALDVDMIEFLSDKEKVRNPFTGEDDWAFVVKRLKDRGFSPGEVFLRMAQEEIEKDKNK
ncbi:helix-turn-helix transcriptional regulator [Cytobacillus sp. FSL W8-0315]|uniref:helix-turn-helix domain-containing protein n=1 Tax=Cytobacillus sp. FSL W8-0315 TaxID=2921600 RepID=UPI0030F819C4